MGFKEGKQHCAVTWNETDSRKEHMDTDQFWKSERFMIAKWEMNSLEILEPVIGTGGFQKSGHQEEKISILFSSSFIKETHMVVLLLWHFCKSQDLGISLV